MTEILNTLISAFLQVIVLSLIPFIFFLLRKDKTVSFLKYLGLYKPSKKSIIYSFAASSLFLFVGIVMIFFDDGFQQIVTNPPSVTGNIRIIESKSIAFVVILIIALIKTSLTEEIFFRGFIAKRLMKALGYKTGNIIQALIFGLVHLLIFWKLMHPTLFVLMFIFIFSTIAGWVIGLIKEKYANGSIIPGWIAHALGNTLSYIIIVFFL